MKPLFHRFLHVLALLLLGLFAIRAEAGESAARKAPAGKYIIGLSPYLADTAKDGAYRHIVRLLVEDMPLNSSLWIYDAYHLSTVAHVEIPEVRAFESSRTRVNQFKDGLLSLKRFLATSHAKPEVRGLRFDEAMRLPQFLRFVSENLVDTNQPPVVIVMGSPLYMDEKEPSFSMMEGYFPSDGHLLAASDKSVYGVKDRPQALSGVVVHFAYFGDPWLSELQHEKIARFWGLFIQQQGGRLATFSGDLPTVFNAIRSGSTPGQLAALAEGIDPAKTKIEMVRVSRAVGTSDWITADSLSNIYTNPPSTTVGPMKIGIRWKGSIDLDLYARPQGEAETLFFQHNRSAAGYYYKDHRSSPDREYEFIEFVEPVDVQQVEASINFYQGKAAEGPSGEIRIEFDGRIYTDQFAIVSRRGNQGRGGSGQEEFWAPIDIPRILKLR